jgi:hypothetical protein
LLGTFLSFGSVILGENCEPPVKSYHTIRCLEMNCYQAVGDVATVQVPAKPNRRKKE